MKNVYMSVTMTDAAVIRNLLMEHGIQCQLVEKATTQYAAGATEVWLLNDDQKQKAIELIQGVFTKSKRKDDWSCIECTEVNPGNFEVCWACGALKELT